MSSIKPLHLTRAALLVSRGIQPLLVAPAGELVVCAVERRCLIPVQHGRSEA
jgi:hypothetical protein